MNSTIDYIIDANVVFAALMSGKGIYERLSNTYNLYSIDYLYIEIEKHKEVIKAKTTLDETQFLPYFLKIFSRINVLPNMVLTEDAYQKGYDLCLGVDLNDMLYVSLSVLTGYPLITRDVPLYEHLRKQKYKNIVLLHDIITTL